MVEEKIKKIRVLDEEKPEVPSPRVLEPVQVEIVRTFSDEEIQKMSLSRKRELLKKILKSIDIAMSFYPALKIGFKKVRITVVWEDVTLPNGQPFIGAVDRSGTMYLSANEFLRRPQNDRFFTVAHELKHLLTMDPVRGKRMEEEAIHVYGWPDTPEAREQLHLIINILQDGADNEFLRLLGIDVPETDWTFKDIEATFGIKPTMIPEKMFRQLMSQWRQFKDLMEQLAQRAKQSGKMDVIPVPIEQNSSSGGEQNSQGQNSLQSSQSMQGSAGSMSNMQNPQQSVGQSASSQSGGASQAPQDKNAQGNSTNSNGGVRNASDKHKGALGSGDGQENAPKGQSQKTPASAGGAKSRGVDEKTGTSGVRTQQASSGGKNGQKTLEDFLGGRGGQKGKDTMSSSASSHAPGSSGNKESSNASGGNSGGVKRGPTGTSVTPGQAQQGGGCRGGATPGGDGTTSASGATGETGSQGKRTQEGTTKGSESSKSTGPLKRPIAGQEYAGTDLGKFIEDIRKSMKEVIKEGDPDLYDSDDPGVIVEKWNKVLAQAITTHVATRGTGAGNMLSQLLEYLKSPISWRNILKAVILDSIGRTKIKRTYTRPPRKIEGAAGKKRIGPRRIWVLEDTSGSISDEMLSKVRGDIYEIAEYTRSELIVVPWDDVVYEPVVIKRRSDWDKIEHVPGRGGTTLLKPLKYMLDQLRRGRVKYGDIIIIFSDFYVEEITNEHRAIVAKLVKKTKTPMILADTTNWTVTVNRLYRNFLSK